MRTTIAALLLAATAFGCSPPDGEPAPTPTSRPRRERVRVKSVPARSAPVAEPSADIPRPVPHVTAPSTEIAPQTAGTEQPEATQPPEQAEPEAPDPVMKKKLGVVKFFAAAAGREPESDLRVRKEWLAWINGKRGETYVATITYGSEVMGEAERAHALVGAIDAVREAAKRDSGR